MNEETPWWEVLTKTNRELKADDPVRYRLGRVGHTLPLSKAWVRTVGLWGGQRTAAEISKITNKNSRAVRSYAQARNLRLASRNNPPVPQAVVALRCFTEWGLLVHGHLNDKTYGHFLKDATLTALAVGVYPIEAIYYIRAVPELCDLAEESHEDLADFSNDELQQLWAQARLPLFYPEHPNVTPEEVNRLLAGSLF